MSKSIIFLFIYLTFIISCAKNNVGQDIIDQDVETEMVEAYREGIEQLESGDPLYASKKFAPYFFFFRFVHQNLLIRVFF